MIAVKGMGTPKIVLTADRTLMSPYRGLSLATFFGCAPALDPNRDKKSFWYKILGNQVTPKILFDFICNWSPDIDGAAKYAPYGLRKLEAGLLRDGFARKDVVVAHPNHIEKFMVLKLKLLELMKWILLEWVQLL